MPTKSQKSNSSGAQAPSYSVSSNGSSSRKPVRNNGMSDAWHIRIPKIKPPKPPKFNWPAGRLSAVSLLAALIIGVGAGFAGGYWGSGVRADNGTVTGSLSAQKKIVTSQSQLISQIAKTVGPSVVS